MKHHLKSVILQKVQFVEMPPPENTHESYIQYEKMSPENSHFSEMPQEITY